MLFIRVTFPEWELFQKFKRFIEAPRTPEFSGPGEGQGGRGTETTNLAADGPQGRASPPWTSWVTQSKSMSISEPQLVPGRTTDMGTKEGGSWCPGLPAAGPAPPCQPHSSSKGVLSPSSYLWTPRPQGGGRGEGLVFEERAESSLGESTLA